MALGPAEIECLHRGIEHFRAGDYFAAHDDWEEVWQGLRGRQRTFWQAMIQLVVGAYHLRNGNRKGCESLWRKALAKCTGLTQTYETDVPTPLLVLTHLLSECLASLYNGVELWPSLTHFANIELSETWYTFP